MRKDFFEFIRFREIVESWLDFQFPENDFQERNGPKLIRVLELNILKETRCVWVLFFFSLCKKARFNNQDEVASRPITMNQSNSGVCTWCGPCRGFNLCASHPCKPFLFPFPHQFSPLESRIECSSFHWRLWMKVMHSLVCCGGSGIPFLWLFAIGSSTRDTCWRRQPLACNSCRSVLTMMSSLSWWHLC